MLPFLKNKQDGSMSMPVESKERKPDEGAEYDSLHAAAEDLLHAMKSESVSGVAAALRAAFEICDLEPHEEGEHI